MSVARDLYTKFQNKPFSYGETLNVILEHEGKAITSLPNEDFIFPDKSILRVTNNNIQILEYLTE
jgi:hypothetical protein